MSLPELKLDDKSFQELVDEAKKLIPIYAPEWTDFNVHDPGITLIELFAWLAEIQMYHLDQITDKNKLKFLKMLGEHPRPATAAKVEVTFSSESSEVVPVSANTKLAAVDQSTGELVIFETTKTINVLPKAISIAEIRSQDRKESINNTQANELKGHFYHAFGKTAEKDSALYIGFNTSPSSIISASSLTIDLMVYIYEEDLKKPGEHGFEVPDVDPSVSLKWEYQDMDGQWKGLTVNDETFNFTSSGIISFDIPPNQLQIRCRVDEEGYEIPPRIEEIRLNTVKALHREQIKGEDGKGEELGSSNWQPNQLFYLPKPPALDKKTQIFTNDNENNKLEWFEVTDFDASKEDDLHFVLDPTKGEILFGDGVNGMIPPLEHKISAIYIHGDGEKGNLAAGQINQIQDDNLTNLEVVNERPATGGLEKELIEDAIIRVKRDLMVPYQAVTSPDYEYLTINTPGLRVARAKAVPDKTANLVKVLVIPESPLTKPLASEGFLKTVCRHLDKHRLITTQINVENPEYVEVAVCASLKPLPGYDYEALKERAADKLSRFLNPLVGWTDGKGWPFGRDVHVSEIYEVLDDVDGVDCVSEVALENGNHEFDGERLMIHENDVVCSGKHHLETLGLEEGCVKERYP